MSAEQAGAPRGVAAKILGVVMVIVGGLDMMLFWRNGQAPSWFFVSIIAIGLLVYFIGSVRAGSTNELHKSPNITPEQGR